MKKLEFKISRAHSKSSGLFVNIQPRKWYVAWLWVKTFVKYIIKRQ